MSTLEVASSRIRNCGLCASARAKLTSWRWPTENVEPRSLTGVSRPSGRESRKWPEAHFAQGALDGGAVDGCGAQADVRFERAGEQERILQDDAELAAQILHVQFADVDAVEQDLAALDVVEAQQELNGGGFAGAGVADDGDGLAGLDAEGDIAQNPIFFAGIAPPR